MSLVAYFERFPLFRDYVLPLIASPTRRRLASGAFWGGIAGVASRAFTVAASFFLARILGQEGFGEYGVINSTTAMISGMAGLGIGTTVIKYVAELKDKDPVRAGRILALSTVVTTVSAALYGGVFVIFAPWLAAKTLAAPHLAPMLQISAITVALGVVNSVQSCSLAGCEAFRASSAINIVCTITQTALVLIGAWFWKVPGTVVALALSMVVTVVATRWVVAQEWKRFNITLNWREAISEWRVLIRYSLPTFLCGLSAGPVVWGCNALLANQPAGYAQLGIYNAANQWQSAIQFLPALIGTAILPVMSERHGNGDVQGGLRVMKGMMGVTALIVIPAALLVCACGPWIMRGYGASFVSGYWVLFLSVITAALLAVMTPVGQYLAACGRMWTAFAMNAGWGVCMLVSAWLMVRWGAEGLAGARLIAYLAHSVWVLLFVVFQKRLDH